MGSVDFGRDCRLAAREEAAGASEGEQLPPFNIQFDQVDASQTLALRIVVATDGAALDRRGRAAGNAHRIVGRVVHSIIVGEVQS